MSRPLRPFLLIDGTVHTFTPDGQPETITISEWTADA